MTNNGNMPAMPQAATSEGYSCHYYDYDGPGIPTGMTKREMMAMHVASGLISSGYDATFEQTARLSVNYADALLAELERTK